MKKRCEWAKDEPNTTYHDNEWGVPVHDDVKLFEFLILEGAQAGLSWSTILNRRDGYLTAFSNFDVVAVSKYTQNHVKKLVKNKALLEISLKLILQLIMQNSLLKFNKNLDLLINTCGLLLITNLSKVNSKNTLIYLLTQWYLKN